MKLAVAVLLAGIAASSASLAAPTSVLFVGNSYTFGRVDPVMSYNAANVHDLTASMYETNPQGSNPYEPRPWGGVPGIFKQLTVEAGLDYEVSMSARNAASLRGHFLNTNPAGWDLRGNIASKKWDKVVLQDLSDEPLPNHKGANANLALFEFYANKIVDYIHNGIKPGQDLATDVLNTTEGLLWGGPSSGTPTQRAENCIVGTGGSTTLHPNPDPNPNALSRTACNTTRTIKGNPNENPAAKVYLYQTWARPDMVFPHLATIPDDNYPTVPDGRPIIDTAGGSFPNGYPDTLYYEAEGLAGMTDDLYDAYESVALLNPNIEGVIPVGDAFQRAVDTDIAKGVGFYNDQGTYAEAVPQDKINLWWIDYLHASKHGSYLSALVIFGKLTGVDPASFGANEKAAADLGISPGDAVKLQRVASDQLAADGVSLTTIPCLHANQNAKGAGAGSQSALVCGRGRGK